MEEFENRTLHISGHGFKWFSKFRLRLAFYACLLILIFRSSTLRSPRVPSPNSSANLPPTRGGFNKCFADTVTSCSLHTRRLGARLSHLASLFYALLPQDSKAIPRQFFHARRCQSIPQALLLSNLKLCEPLGCRRSASVLPEGGANGGSCYLHVPGGWEWS